MEATLAKYIPERSVDRVFGMIKQQGIHLKIVRERKTRHGDYRRLPGGQHQITVNANLNKYRFLITLVHEIAHLVAFKKFGRYIKPHGQEWKYTFQQLMSPFLTADVFPVDLLPLLKRHFQNPRASSDTDEYLAVALKRYDPENHKSYVYELPEGSIFRIANGRIFKKGRRKIKRYECVELETGRKYIFQPHAEVELIRKN